MATLAERYWQELRPLAAVRLDLQAAAPRRRPRRRVRQQLTRRAR